jgi:hypothetical protein
MNFRSTPWIVHIILRLTVGVSMVLVGISLYRDFGNFGILATVDLGTLRILGAIWSYLLPGLLILGGGMLVVGRYSFVTAWVGGTALGSVPIGMFFKTLMTNFRLEDALNFAYPMFIWMMLFAAALLTSPDAVEEE